MRQPLQASDPSGLAQITGALHDLWFDADCIVFESASQALRIPFALPANSELAKESGELRGRQGPAYLQAWLVVRSVTDWTFEDTERVGLYDFNWIRYEAGSRTIRFDTGIPIRMEAKVDRIDVSVEVSAEECKTAPKGRFV